MRAASPTPRNRSSSPRHRDLSRTRNQVACRLHAALCDLIPGGVSKQIRAAAAARVPEQARPSGAVQQARRELAEFHPGDWVAYDSFRPVQLLFQSDWDACSLLFPRETVQLSESERRIMTARRTDGSTGLTGVMSRFLLDLERTSEHVPAAQPDKATRPSTAGRVDAVPGRIVCTEATGCIEKLTAQAMLTSSARPVLAHAAARPG